MSHDTPGEWPEPNSAPGPAAPSPGWAPPAPGGDDSPAAPVVTGPSVEQAWWRRPAVGLPLGVWLGVGLLAIAGIVAGAIALGDDGDEPKLAIDVPVARPTSDAAPGAEAPDVTAGATVATDSDGAPVPTTGAPRTTPAETAESSAPPTSATVVASEGDGSEPTKPLPVGHPQLSRFGHDTPFGPPWTGSIAGVVEVPLYFEEDSGERCFMVLGSVTPLETDGLVSDAWSTPQIALFVDGEEAGFGELACDTAELEQLGYRSLFDANATPGTDFAFYAEFSLAESLGVPQAVGVSINDETWRFYSAALLDQAPRVTPGAVGDVFGAAPIEDGAPGAFSHVDEYSGDEWSGTIAGLMEVPNDTSGSPAGRCFAVVGTLTADAVTSVTSRAYSAPAIALIADGRLVDDYDGCSQAEAEAAGYEWFSGTEVTAGTRVGVYATLMVRDPLPGNLQAIVVGDPWSEAPTVFTPHLLTSLPRAEQQAGPPPPGLAEAGAPVTVQDVDGITWNVTVHGHLATGPSGSDTPGDCVVVFADASAAFGTQHGTPPELFVVAGGRVLSEDFRCDTDAARDAGYVEQWTELERSGAVAHVFAAFRIPPGFDPQAVLVGRGGLDHQAGVAPNELGAIPPIPG